MADTPSLNVSKWREAVEFAPGVHWIGALDPTLRTFEIKGQVASADGLVVPGQMANLTIVFEARQGLGVPSASILGRGGQSVVFVVQDGKAIAKEVQPGFQNDAWTEILSGLEAGETVVTEGQTQLRDGMAVDVL